MDRQSFPFQEQDIRRVLGSPEGQKLLQLLNRDGGQALRQAANALRSGNTQAAMEVLSPIMETKEAAELVEQINRQ